MSSMPRTAAQQHTASVTTGRKAADRIADTTRRSAAVWIAEAQGVERRRRAAAQHIAELIGTETPRWTGEIGTEDWAQVLSAGADALLALGGKGSEYFWLNLVDSAEVYTAEAAALADTDDLADRTLTAPSEHQVDELLASQELDPTVALPWEAAAIAEWSPFRNGPRHVVRCADGTRRYGNGELAEVA